MTKKDRRTIANMVAGVFLIVGLYLYWKVFKSTSIYWLGSILLLTPIIEEMVFGSLPAKKRKKKEKKSAPSRVPVNRLRTDDEIMASSIKELSWREFERLCFLYYRVKGYKPKETGEGADGGVDLVIYNRQHKIEEAVQIKHYINSGNRITVQQIRELNTAKRNHDCLLTRFITSSGYTKDALIEADKYRMICHDLNWVENKIGKWQQQEQSKKQAV